MPPRSPRARAHVGGRSRRCTNCWSSIPARSARYRYRITPATRGSRILRSGVYRGCLKIALAEAVKDPCDQSSILFVARSCDHVADEQVDLCFGVQQVHDLAGCGGISYARGVPAEEVGAGQGQIKGDGLREFDILIVDAVLVPGSLKAGKNIENVRSVPVVLEMAV